MAAETTFSSLVHRAWRQNVLLSVLVELTYRCNLDCWFCYNDLSLVGKPMATAEWLRLLEDLHEMQVLNLTLSGGEPLAHPDFMLLGGRARDLGFVVRVKSNGHAIGGTLARRLKDEVDPFVVEVSLHGAQPETHDRQTRVPGSFDRLCRNIAEMQSIGLRVQVNSTLTAWNEDQIEGMFALADALGVSLQLDPEVTPRDDGDRRPLTISPSREGVLRLLTLQAQRSAAAGVVPARQADRLSGAAELGKHCGAGSSGLTIDPYGNVYPCVQWRRPVGNLHETSVREIWTGSSALDAVRGLTREVKQMVDGLGEDGPLMSFCPGQAEAMTGSPLVVYPGAQQRADLTRETRKGRLVLRVLPG